METQLQAVEAKLEKEHTKGPWKEIPAEAPGKRRQPKPIARPHLCKWDKISQLPNEAILFSINDRPILEPLGLYSEEAKQGGFNE